MTQYLDAQADLDEYDVDGQAPHRVIVGVDASAHAAHAAGWAAEEALRRGVPLTLVHAIDLPGASSWPVAPPAYAQFRRADGQKLLDAAAADVRARFPGLSVQTELSELSAAHTLSALSEEAALLVTGTRGHGGFTGLLLGSVSRKLAAHGHCPLVVVRAAAAETEAAPGAEAGDEVLLGVEPDQPESAVRFAFAAAARYGATLRAVRVWWPVAIYTGPSGGYYEDVTRTPAEEAADVEQLLAPVRAAFPQVKVEISAVRGNAVAELVDAARAARLVVVGAHRYHGPLAVGAGYVVEGMLAHSPVPVAVVPAA
ncbi:universal stress protein [Actinospica durhamensis]|uniref:Universal stress protein n=1 Tax=Actinospica durhamensis TaxID=1508375 RepID=A0A941ETB4_9ACTN|nr:universal stress protein [Actinospica durhamensis]MBR7834714.1 universal stress protein [Actinospica durhamensis]